MKETGHNRSQQWKHSQHLDLRQGAENDHWQWQCQRAWCGPHWVRLQHKGNTSEVQTCLPGVKSKMLLSQDPQSANQLHGYAGRISDFKRSFVCIPPQVPLWAESDRNGTSLFAFLIHQHPVTLYGTGAMLSTGIVRFGSQPLPKQRILCLIA